MIENIATHSDRFAHDMTTENFLCWLRTLDLYHRPRWAPYLVRRYLETHGFNVADVCEDTATLTDMCGGRHIRVLPRSIGAAFREMEFGGSVRNLITYLEARI